MPRRTRSDTNSSSNSTNPSNSDLTEVVRTIVNKDHAFNFDFTLELAMPRMRVGTLRIQGTVESVGSKRGR
jgi:hypothetical protein